MGGIGALEAFEAIEWGIVCIQRLPRRTLTVPTRFQEVFCCCFDDDFFCLDDVFFPSQVCNPILYSNFNRANAVPGSFLQQIHAIPHTPAFRI